MIFCLKNNEKKHYLPFEEGIEKTVKWYLDNQAWMDNVTSGDDQQYYGNMYKGR